MASTSKIDSTKKIIYGYPDNKFISEETVSNTAQQVRQIMTTLNCKEYALLIDCTDMGVFEQTALQLLQKTWNLFMEAGFRKIVFVNPKNAIQNMQIQKMIKNMPQFKGEFVDSLAEAEKRCKVGA